MEIRMWPRLPMKTPIRPCNHLSFGTKPTAITLRIRMYYHMCNTRYVCIYIYTHMYAIYQASHQNDSQHSDLKSYKKKKKKRIHWCVFFSFSLMIDKKKRSKWRQKIHPTFRLGNSFGPGMWNTALKILPAINFPRTNSFSEILVDFQDSTRKKGCLEKKNMEASNWCSAARHLLWENWKSTVQCFPGLVGLCVADAGDDDHV